MIFRLLRDSAFALTLFATAASEAATPAGDPGGHPSVLPVELRHELVAQLQPQLERSDDGDRRIVTVTLEQQRLLGLIAVLRDKGLVDKDLKDSYVEDHRFLYSNLLGMLAASLLVEQLYGSDATVDRTSWTVELDYPLEGAGNDKKQMMAFDFTRPAFSGIDWARLSYMQFPSVAPHFASSPWMSWRAGRDLTGTIDQD